MEALFLPHYQPFTVSLMVLSALVALEVIMLVSGLGIFSFIDELVPEIGDSDGLTFSKVLGFVGFGKVPALMVLMALFATFGLSGIILQNAWNAVSGTYLAAAAACPAATVLALIATAKISKGLARIIPDSTSAVSRESLIGCEATINFGNASFYLPAGARVSDAHGNIHHIQVKSSAPEELLIQGQNVKIVSFNGGFYIATQPAPGE